MAFAMLLLVQSVSGPPAPAPPPVRIDRVAEEVKRDCRGEGNEIVVCGSEETQSAYRLKPLPEKFVAEQPKAELDLGGGAKAAAELEAHSVGGFTSNRVMARIKLPF